ncbi:MAG: N-formylglutamate amidohydrolase [Pseudomonadota bacterium]
MEIIDTISGDPPIHKSSLEGVFTFFRPQKSLPLIFDSPHSGIMKPADFHHACPDSDIMRTADMHVDELFKDVPNYGAAFLQAEFPRAYIDLNRKIDDIDPETYIGEWPVGKEGYETPNPTERSYAGIGLIRRLIRPGTALYKAPLKVSDIHHRIQNYYKPYHQVLEGFISDAHYHFGQVWHINCHSMPSSSVAPASDRSNPQKQVDFVLGDRNGTTCPPDMTRMIKQFFDSIGYNIAINDPYKGVELVERYSEPAKGMYSLQIEINKALYMDEETGLRNKNFVKLKDDLNAFANFFSQYVDQNLMNIAAD